MNERITFPELPRADTWEAACEGFTWSLPGHYNIADLISGRWAQADPDRLALIDLGADGGERRWSHLMLSRRAAQLANSLAAKGVKRGIGSGSCCRNRLRH